MTNMYNFPQANTQMLLFVDHDAKTLVHVQQSENTKQQEIGSYTQKIYLIIVYQGDCRS